MTRTIRSGPKVRCLKTHRTGSDHLDTGPKKSDRSDSD